MADSPYALAAVLSTRDPQRLYSALSVLVSSASEGTRCAALLSFGSLELVLDPGLLQRAATAEATPSLTWGGRDTFARSLAELRDAALDLEALDLFACSASTETMGLTEADLGRIEGIRSTPRFLRETAGAQLVLA